MKDFLRREQRWLVVLTAIFVASRVVVRLAGITFDTSPLETYWQFLDRTLLETDLLRSLVDLHSQPPLFNLYLGLGLKLGSLHPSFFAAISHLAGLATCLGAYALARYFAIGRPLAAIFAALLVLRASFVLQENLLFYDISSTALLVVAALGLAAGLGGRSWGSHLFFGALFLLCGSRSLFHLGFFLLALALWLAATRARNLLPRLQPALLPLLLLVAIYGKNWLLFDQFGVSSWFGLNLARVVWTGYDDEERTAKMASGRMSPLFAIRPIVPIERYPPALWQDAPFAGGPPALTALTKTNGEPNYNHRGFLALGPRYRKAAFADLRDEPLRYLRIVWAGARFMLRPTTDVHTLAPYREPLGAYVDLWEKWLAGRITVQVGELRGKPLYTHRFLAFLLWPAAVAFGAVWWWRSRRPGRLALTPERRATLAFLLLSIAWVALVGNLFEVGENQRFRFYTDPLTMLLLTAALDRLRGWRSRRRLEADQRT